MVRMIAIAALMVFSYAVVAQAAEKEKRSYPHYWMSVATTNQSIPGMSEEMSGMAAMFGGRGPAFGPRRDLQLQLESPRQIKEEPDAAHDIPPGMNMGTSLPLGTPKIEKTDYVPDERGKPEKYEKPKARMLIYWGCGESVGKGQPKVLDTEKMSPAEFGRSFGGRAVSHQTPPNPHGGWTYGDWPNSEERKDIPRDSSLVGEHLVHGNYVTNIKFALDKKRDFMAPVEFTSVQPAAGGAVKTEWKQIPTAIGYFATAMGHDEKSGDTIFWSASEVQEIGFALMDYLTPGDVNRFIKEKVVMGPSRTSCTVPPIFKDMQGAMLQFIAYGEELNLVHPPKPKDPKQPWDPQWSVKVRLKSTGMTPLMASGEEGSRKSRASSTRKSKQKPEPQEDESGESAPPSDENSGSGTSKGGVGERLRGLFGF